VINSKIRLRVGDEVIVLLGKDKGRKGKISKVYIKKGTVLLPELNVYKKHVKKATAKDGKGGIYDVPRPIAASKVALVCPKCKKQTRIGLDKEKKRVCRKCGKKIDPTSSRRAGLRRGEWDKKGGSK